MAHFFLSLLTYRINFPIADLSEWETLKIVSMCSCCWAIVLWMIVHFSIFVCVLMTCIYWCTLYTGTWVYRRRCRHRRHRSVLYLVLTCSHCWRHRLRRRVTSVRGYLDWCCSSWTCVGATLSPCRAWGSAPGWDWLSVSISFSTSAGTAVPMLLMLLQVMRGWGRQRQTLLHQSTHSSNEVS